MARTAASGATSRAVPSVSVHPSGPDQSLSDATGAGEPKSTSHTDAQYDCSEDPLLTYCPEGGFTDDDSILSAIDLIEDTPANKYLSDARMARYSESGKLKGMHFQRLKVFQLIVNLIDAAQSIVRQSVAIQQVKENYESMMKRSLEAHFILQEGGTMDLGNNASRESRHQELKHCKIVEVPKFDVNKNNKLNRNSPTVKARQLGSKELDLNAWTEVNNAKNKRRIPAKERLEQPNTYASKLKGPAPGPSAKLPEQPLKFVKRNSNKVKR